MIVLQPYVSFFSGKVSTVRSIFHTRPAERNLLTDFLSGSFFIVKWSLYWCLFLCDKVYFSVFYVACFRFWDLKQFLTHHHICLGNFQIGKAVKHKHTLKYPICDWLKYTRNVILVSKWKNVAAILHCWHKVAAIMLSGGGQAWAAIYKLS